MSDAVCLAMTASGEPCRKKPGLSGYCTQHDPQKAAEREEAHRVQLAVKEANWAKGIRFREVLDSIESTCKAKGWHCKVEHTDQETWRHASVVVRRKIPGATGFNFDTDYVEGAIDVSVDPSPGVGMRLLGQRTSRRDMGFEDLVEAMDADLRRLFTLSPKDTSVPSTNVLHTQQPEPKTDGAANGLSLLLTLLSRFHRIARQLRDRHDERDTLIINDEYDVQDLLHALLREHFDDIRPEETTPSYAGGRSRLDFLLKREKIVIEVKYATERLRDRHVGEQLIIDKARYRAHPDCTTLVCFIYDPDGQLANPQGLITDLSGKDGNLDVRVIICPRGR